MSGRAPSRVLRAGTLAAAIGLALSACGGEAGQTAAVTSVPTATAGPSAPGTKDGGPVRIATGATEQTRVIADMYAQRLRDEGIAAEVVDLGTDRAGVFRALKSGRADVVADFTGDLYLYTRENEKGASAPRTPTASPAPTSGPGLLGSLGALLGITGETGPSGDDVYGALPEALPKGVRVLEQSAAENTDRFVVTKATAAEYELGDLDTVSGHCDGLAVGMPSRYADTAQGSSGLAAYYDCVPKATPELPVYEQRVTALLEDRVQAAVLPASAPAITDNGLTVLADPHRLYRPERLVPVVSTGLTDRAVSVLNSTTTSVRTEDLSMITRLVSGENPDMDPAEAADFILDQPR